MTWSINKHQNYLKFLLKLTLPFRYSKYSNLSGIQLMAQVKSLLLLEIILPCQQIQRYLKLKYYFDTRVGRVYTTNSLLIYLLITSLYMIGVKCCLIYNSVGFRCMCIYNSELSQTRSKQVSPPQYSDQLGLVQLDLVYTAYYKQSEPCWSSSEE